MSSDDLDPSDFVKRIQELGKKRDEEDAERFRALEEQILQDRSERLARRAERARSLSPSKPSAPNTPLSTRSSRAGTPAHEAVAPSPSMSPSVQTVPRETAVADALQRLTSASTPAQDADLQPTLSFRTSAESGRASPSIAVSPSRSGTLSWQRRPTSSSGRRPLSMVAAENSAARSPHVTPDLTSVEEGQTSRTQISQALSSKDPSWFKQTADRGVGSAAYRRSEEDNVAGLESAIAKRKLPGMSRESASSTQGTSSPPPENVRSSSPSRAGSVRGSVASWGNRFSSDTSASGSSALDGKSPLPTSDAQKFEPPVTDGALPVDDGAHSGTARTLAMSPAQGRISPERTDRPASPTKGMGGFVQSAMLKRSDSMNKRWSVQATPSLSRQNSTASARNGLAGSLSMPRPDSRPESISRDNSLGLNSRPSSSHSKTTITQDFGAKPEGFVNGDYARTPSSHHSRAKSVTAMYTSSIAEDHESTETSPPPSPSKRWSPTKSSWLESALQKPESPKPKVQPVAQPSWMAEINKAKQQKVIAKSDSITPSNHPSATRKEVQGLPNKSEITQTPIAPLTKAKPSALSTKPPDKFNEDTTSGEISRIVGKTSAVQAPTPMLQQPLNAPKAPVQPPKSAPPSISARPKPETPPKKDFRSALKPRQDQSAAPPKEELEFQNVFGKLKRTQTEKYVAPDELRNNILRGKSGLAVTSGPQKTPRKDELKDSLLRQKEAMKSRVAEEPKPSVVPSNDSSHKSPIPEALAMRETLSRSHVNAKSAAGSQGVEPEAIARQKTLKERPKPSLPEKELNVSAKLSSGEPAATNKLADRFNPALAGILAHGPPQIANSGKPKPAGQSHANGGGSLSQPGIGEANEEVSSGQLIHKTKGRARGPKRRAPTAKSEDVEVKEATAMSIPVVPLVKAKNVLHSTSPRATSASHTAAAVIHEQRPVTPSKPQADTRPETPGKSPVLAGIKVSSQRRSEQPQPRKPSSSLKGLLAEKAKPVPLEESSTTLSELRTSPQNTPKTGAGSFQQQQQQQPHINTTLANGSDAVHEDARETHTSPTISVKNAAALWGRQSATASPSLSHTKSPIKLPTRADESAAMENAGLTQRMVSQSQPVGLGLGFAGTEAPQMLKVTQMEERAPPNKYPMSPPLSAGLPPKPAKKPDHIASREPSASFKSPLSSPIPHTSEAGRLLADFFNESPTTTNKGAVDTQAILTSNPLNTGKIKTLRKQMQEISGDGKVIAVPAPEEHILFEDSMYICTHVFGDSKGAKTTEVYLWAGSGVSESAVENVQLFGRKVAKENNGKLIVLRQGKETPNFFQGLGGIVITRRGTRLTNDSFAVKPKPYMLCCRRHMSHITFDEVELSASSMCSGFAYIISSPSGKLFLWKGIGCNAEELGCARLIGMDLGVSGEIEEVDEGHEPQALLDALSAPTIPRSADHWRLRATCPKYNVRLFRVDQVQQQQQLQVSSFWPLLVRRPSWSKSSVTTPTSSPQTPDTPQATQESQVQTKVVEIAPFCQTDIEAECIYVLDAFFELYIIVGPLAQSQHHAFSTALLFAQEYGILAASLEDRPFIPVSTVVLEGVPRDMKAVFRRWEERFMPTSALMAGKPKRGKSLRIVGLTAAIAATRT